MSTVKPAPSTGAQPALVQSAGDADRASTTSTPIKTVSLIDRARAAKKNPPAPLGKRTQATYPIQKPLKSKFVRVHPSTEYRISGVLTYTDSDSSEVYYVSPDLELPESIQSQTRVTDLYAAQTHDNTHFIWFIHRSDTSWYRAAVKAIRETTSNWRRVVSRKAANTYDLYAPEGPIPEPDWDGLPAFQEMLSSGFEERMITSNDHPVLRKLRGLGEDE